MKTKHLLYSLAVASAFTACTNEDFLSEGQNNSPVAERPVVGNVTLSVHDDADTRMVYEGGYKFEPGDKMAALLMDENITTDPSTHIGNVTKPAKWNELTWLEKYHLTDYVHTNYPFVYGGNGEWKTDANMLEGNYFLTFPYVTFNGNREAYYDITNQAQVGNDADARRRALAENQFFIGYTKLDAKEGNESVVKAKLHPVLCPLRINIESHLDHKVEVTKIVLHHSDLYSQITLDPTRAKYTGKKEGENVVGSDKAKWNLTKVKNANDRDNVFNYANYLATAWGTEFDGSNYKKELYENARYGSMLEEDYVYNIARGDEGVAEGGKEHVAGRYYASDALRAVVKPLTESNNTDYASAYAQLYLKDTENSTGMELTKENTIKCIIMVPPFDATEESLRLTIYTNEGIVGDINISEPNDDGTYSNVQTTGEIKKATPETPFTTNTVTVVLNAGAITRIPIELEIDETGDLEKYVEYIAASDQNQTYTAYINNDVVVTDELAEKILGLKNSSLKFEQLGVSGNNLKFATTAKAWGDNKTTADVLEKLELAFDKDAEGVRIEIMEGATLNLSAESRNKDKDDLLFVVRGTLDIKGENTVYGGYNESGEILNGYSEIKVNVKESGTVNVNADKVVGIKFINNGVMNVMKGNELYVAPNTKNNIKGIVNVSGMLSGTTNENFHNLGTIKNYGELYNILNEKPTNSEGIRPGYIYVCEDANLGTATRTGLSKNEGIVVYDGVLGTVRNDGEEELNTGFVYEGGNVTYTALQAALVTQATISGTLSVDASYNEDKGTVLKKLIIENGEIISTIVPNTQATISVEKLELNKARVSNIKFAKMSLEEDAAVLRGEIIFEEDVEFTGSLLLDVAHIKNKGKLTGTTMSAVVGKNSNFVNDGTVTKLQVDNKNNISISGSKW